MVSAGKLEQQTLSYVAKQILSSTRRRQIGMELGNSDKLSSSFGRPNVLGTVHRLEAGQSGRRRPLWDEMGHACLVGRILLSCGIRILSQALFSKTWHSTGVQPLLILGHALHGPVTVVCFSSLSRLSIPLGRMADQVRSTPRCHWKVSQIRVGIFATRRTTPGGRIERRGGWMAMTGCGG